MQAPLQKVLVDNVIGHRRLHLLVVVILVLLGLRALGAIIGATRQYVMSWLGEKITFERRAEVPEPRPQTLLFDADRREIPDFVANLGVVPEVGNEMHIALRNQQQCARARKTGEIAHVRKAREHECVDVCGGEPIAKRGNPRGAAISHWRQPAGVSPIRATPVRNRTSRIRRRPPSPHLPAPSDDARARARKCW